MRQTFEAQHFLPFPRDLVFAFFANPRNLPLLMPAWQQARITEATFCAPPPRPAGTPEYPGIAAGAGTLLTITARGVPGLPLRGTWIAKIEDFGWNDHFCDVQLSGPFAYWRHCHSVSVATSAEDGSPGTMVHDRVTYELPLDAVSRIGYPALKAVMTALFAYRGRRALELVSAFDRTVQNSGKG